MMPTTVDTLDPALEQLRLLERYFQMSDDEVLALTRQGSELTDVAQHALVSEISRRGLKVQSEETPAPVNPEPPPDPPYAKDRELVEICTVWSLSDALQLQALLDRAGIPFFMGPEKAAGVDGVTSNFGNGVSVQIMRIGLPWANQAMQDYTPANDPASKQEGEGSELPLSCPKCNSTDIVFERLIPEPPPATGKSSSKYKWTCDSCGQHWEDDGIVKLK